MKRWHHTLISPAVFAYTFYIKFKDWRYWVLPCLIALLPTFSLITIFAMPHPPLTAESQKTYGEGIQTFFVQPIIYIMVCYLFASDGPVTGKIVGDADTLALLFTRPLTRFAYVITRYLATVLGASLLLIVSLLIAWAVAMCFGLTTINIGPIAMASIVCNAMSWSALIIFMHCAAPLMAFLVWFILTGCAGVGGIYSRAEQSADFFWELIKSICLFINNWFGDLLPSSIDLLALTSAAAFDTYEFAIFISNIGFFLLLSVFALTHRELSYGAD